ncbi:MAG: lasso RiPP family leader peptide-containing protein [Caldilineaceae bacterium]|nr:lasso RiPP family leader peptide-containing protein [Caldilineaceae bacterium]
MNNQLIHLTPDHQPEARPQKQPYAAPALKKLGTVQELTQGVAMAPEPDVAGFSW